MRVDFPDWQPDQAARVGLAPEIENALPVVGDDGRPAYGPLGAPQSLGFNGPTVGNPTILVAFIDTGNNSFNLLGTDQRIYRLTTSTPTDISRPANYTSKTGWKWEQWGDTIYGVDGAAPLQKYLLGGTNFADVGVPDNLTGKYLATVRNDFLMMAHTTDDVNSTVNTRVRWSAAGNAEDWVPDAATQSSFRDLPGLGEIRGMTGGEYATVLFREGLARGEYIGPPVLFTWDNIEGAVGCDIPETVVRAKDTTYYWSTEGWQAFDGRQNRAIGLERVDRWFRDKLRDRDSVSPCAIPSLDAVGWLFTSVDTPDGNPDRVLFYRYVLDRWGNFRISGRILGTAVGSTALVLDDIDYPVEQIVGSLDDEIYQGSNKAIGAIWAGDTDGIQAMVGPALPGTFETNPFSPADGRRSRMKWARPICVGNDQKVQHAAWSGHIVNGSARLFQYTGEITPQRNGQAMLRREGLYHKLRLKMTGQWYSATGFEYEGIPGSIR